MRKFDLGDKVRIKADNRVGIIVAYQKNVTKYGIERKYKVGGGQIYYHRWFYEYEIERAEAYYEFDNSFELEFINLLIDINLSENKFDVVKQLHEQKQKYSN